MPVLEAFVKRKGLFVTEEELLVVWKAFYGRGSNWRDLTSSREALLKMKEKDHLVRVKKNPLKFLEASSDGSFMRSEGGFSIEGLSPEETGNPAFWEQFEDIVRYRIQDYYQSRYRKEKREDHGR